MTINIDKVVKARFASVCACCGERVEKGWRIKRHESGKWQHLQCALAGAPVAIEIIAQQEFHVADQATGGMLSDIQQRRAALASQAYERLGRVFSGANVAMAFRFEHNIKTEYGDLYAYSPNFSNEQVSNLIVVDASGHIYEFKDDKWIKATDQDALRNSYLSEEIAEALYA